MLFFQHIQQQNFCNNELNICMYGELEIIYFPNLFPFQITDVGS